MTGTDAADQAKLDLVETIHAYKRLFASSDGRRVLADLQRHFSFARKTLLVPGQPDATAANEGRRIVLQHICNYIDVTPDSLDRLKASILNEDDDPHWME
jgi:hypothetical protein